MAITQSTQRVIQVAAGGTYATTGGTNGNFNSRLDDSKLVEAPLEITYIDLTIPADQTQGSVIELWALPIGAVIFVEECKIIVSDDVSSGAVTIDIGDAVDADRYCDGANCASTGEITFISAAFPDAYTNRHEVTEATRLIKLTFATLAATIEAGQIRVKLAWKALQP
jgi:hypothetical protein